MQIIVKRIPLTYGGKKYAVGERLEASDKDAQLLIKVDMVDAAPVAEAARPSRGRPRKTAMTPTQNTTRTYTRRDMRAEG